MADRPLAHLADADLRALYALPDVDGRHARARHEQTVRLLGETVIVAVAQ